MSDQSSIVVAVHGDGWRVFRGERVLTEARSLQSALEAAHEEAKQIFATGEDAEVLVDSPEGRWCEHAYGHPPGLAWTEPL